LGRNGSLIEMPERRANVREIVLGSFRQAHAHVVALQQGEADLIFQIADATADGG
jgi:hypothetical protein